MAKFVVVALAALALLGAQIQTASGATSARADAAALKKCKSGWNKKRCKCPAGATRVKKHKRYRCKKKPAQPQPQTQTPPATAPAPPPPGAQAQRDDAAFEAALSSTMLRRYEEG